MESKASGSLSQGAAGTATAGSNGAVATLPFHKPTYYGMIFVGFGLLLPFNFVLNSIPFFAEYFGPSIGYDIGVSFTTPQLMMQPLMLTLGHLTAPRYRLMGTCIAQAIAMAMMPVLGVSSVGMNGALMALSGMSTAVMESSLFGFASLLPPSYTQGIMVGEAISGILSSGAQLLVKATLADRPVTVARAYFAMACITMLCCAATVYWLNRTHIVRHYLQAQRNNPFQGVEEAAAAQTEAQDATMLHDTTSADLSSITINPEGLTPLDDLNESTSHNSRDKTQIDTSASPYITDGHDGSSLDTPTQTHDQAAASSAQANSFSMKSALRHVKAWVKAVAKVLRQMWMAALAILLNFIATFLFYPGVTSSISFRGNPTPNTLFEEDGGWWTVLLFLVFSVGDLVGRMLAAKTPPQGHLRILLYAISRFIWTPILVGFARHWSGFNNDAIVMIVMMLAAITNGHCVSLCMMEAPQAVGPQHKELAGFVQVLFLHSGISLGSIFALALEQ